MLLDVLDVDVVSVRLLDVSDALLEDVAGSCSFFSGVDLLITVAALGGELIGGIGLNPWTLRASANVVGERLFRDGVVTGAGTTWGPFGGILGIILTSTILF